MPSKLKRRERDTIVQALRAGVVPRLGLAHIQVGRTLEIQELLKDIERIADGGSAVRFIIGDYGSGKTFFLNLIRLIALEKGLVTFSADLAPDRRIYATGGQARGLYAEMARNAATRSKPDGGAIASIVEKFVTIAQGEAESKNCQTGEIISLRLEHFEDMTSGYDFATVIRRYWEGFENNDDELKSSALRWLRGEYSTKTDARKALGVRTIVDDSSIYDHLKLMSAFVRAAGYKGLLVELDELVNLYKLTSRRARDSNYEQILRVLNDVLQGSASHIGFMFGGTPEFLTDTRRGLYSYEALRSRLTENTFATDGLVDLSGPVIRLSSLTPEDLFVLLKNVRQVMQGDENPVPDDALESFMAHCSNRIGEAYFRTPRNTVVAFIQMLSVLEQNPNTDWHDLIEKVEVLTDDGDDLSDIDENFGSSFAAKDDDELASFKL